MLTHEKGRASANHFGDFTFAQVYLQNLCMLCSMAGSCDATQAVDMPDVDNPSTLMDTIPREDQGADDIPMSSSRAE